MNLSVLQDNFLYLLYGAYPHGPLGGMALTILLSVVAGLTSALLGIIGGVTLVMGPRYIQIPLGWILGFLRAIPVLMLIFWTYFMLPILFGIDIPELTTVVLALSLISGAYLSHSVAAGIHAIAPGQWHAGLSLGLSRWAVLHHIIMPRALRMMLPSFINQWIALIKDTSLAYIVGVGELTFVATQVSNRLLVYPMEIFLLTAVMYFVLCATLEIIAHHIARPRKRNALAHTLNTAH
ncbi:MAG: amino acid ABC transporter permease [Ottowia sp.]|nr:amino acid ABC transporter permease [Ottowia sp.]